MNQIILGTTPTILFEFETVDPSTFVAAEMTVKGRSNILLTKTLSGARRTSTQLSWKLTQQETIGLGVGTYTIMCNWLTADGTRGACLETTVKILSNHDPEVMDADESGDSDIVIPITPASEGSGMVTPQMYGAKADDYTDDSAAIQAALDSGKPVYLPHGKYKIDSPIVITDKDYWTFDARDAIITYTGSDYGVKILNARQISVHIGMVYALSGGGIEFYSDSEDSWNQYDILTFRGIFADTDCIRIETAGEGWSNENVIFGGQFSRGENGVHMVRSSGTHGLNGWKFINCGVEGVTNGFLFDAGGSAICNNTIIVPRYSESFETLLKTVGEVYDCKLIAPTPIMPSYIDASSDTTRFIIDAPIGTYWHMHDTAFIRGAIMNGTLMGERPTMVEVST